MAEPIPAADAAQDFATEDGVLPLGRMSLIGTMGTDTVRRALIRLPSGRIERVGVGDTLRGRRIDAIEPERVLLSRNGRQSVLEMHHG